MSLPYMLYQFFQSHYIGSWLYDLSVLLPNSSSYLHVFFLFTQCRQVLARFCLGHLLFIDRLLLYSTPLVSPSLKINLLVPHKAELKFYHYKNSATMDWSVNFYLKRRLFQVKLGLYWCVFGLCCVQRTRQQGSLGLL